MTRRLAQLPPVAVDGALAVAMVGVTIWLGADYHVPGFRDFDRAAVLLTCLATLPLALRRSAPMPVLLISCLAAGWFFIAGYVPSFNLFGPLLALYTVVATQALRTVAVGAVVTTVTIFHSGLSAEVYSMPTAAAQALVATAGACVFGAGARRLTDRNRRLLELTAQLREEREERARAAVLAERVSIARELHDVVAHHMSVISMQAGVARFLLPSGPAATRDALDTIATSSHEALEEMRRMLAVLRVVTAREQRDDCAEPALGLARLDDLVGRVRAAGVPLDVVVTGDLDALPSGVDLCAFRMVQESLTNVLKHARHAHTTVTVDHRPGTLVVQVSDAGPGPTPDPTRRTPGSGLTGMRERAHLYGGTLTAGPAPGRGFVVTLTLPVPAEAERTTTTPATRTLTTLP